MAPLIVHKFFRFHATGFHEGTKRVKQLVPMVKKRLKVGHRLQMVHVVFRCPSNHSEGFPVVYTERELVADVGLDTDHDTQHHVAPGGQGVALEEPGVGGGQEAHGDQLPGVEVLRHPHEGTGVPVVHSVDVFVQKPNLVVRPVPHIVLEVEDDQTGHLVPKKLPERRGKVWQRGGRGPDPLAHGRREHEKHMVPEGQL